MHQRKLADQVSRGKEIDIEELNKVTGGGGASDLPTLGAPASGRNRDRDHIETMREAHTRQREELRIQHLMQYEELRGLRMMEEQVSEN